MPMRLQHGRFGRNAAVFPAALLIKIVNNHNTQPFTRLLPHGNAGRLRIQSGEHVHHGIAGGLLTEFVPSVTKREARDSDIRQTSPFVSAAAWSACSAKKRMRLSSRSQAPQSSISQECAHRWNTPPRFRASEKSVWLSAGQSIGRPCTT